MEISRRPRAHSKGKEIVMSLTLIRINISRFVMAQRARVELSRRTAESEIEWNLLSSSRNPKTLRDK